MLMTKNKFISVFQREKALFISNGFCSGHYYHHAMINFLSIIRQWLSIKQHSVFNFLRPQFGITCQAYSYHTKSHHRYVHIILHHTTGKILPNYITPQPNSRHTILHHSKLYQFSWCTAATNIICIRYMTKDIVITPTKGSERSWTHLIRDTEDRKHT